MQLPRTQLGVCMKIGTLVDAGWETIGIILRNQMQMDTEAFWIHFPFEIGADGWYTANELEEIKTEAI